MKTVAFAVALCTMQAVSVLAQPPVEVGAGLVNATFNVGAGDKEIQLSSPPSVFGKLNPSVYSAIFVGDRVSVDPQLGFYFDRFNGASVHTINAQAQVDVLLADKSRSAPYLFVSAGVVSDSTPGAGLKSMSAGLGYRLPVGDRLVIRLDGRYQHLTNGVGSALSLGVSIGGMLSR